MIKLYDKVSIHYGNDSLNGTVVAIVSTTPPKYVICDVDGFVECATQEQLTLLGETDAKKVHVQEQQDKESAV